MQKVRRFSRFLCALALLLSLSAPACAAEAGFSDVPAEGWFYQGVATCAEQGVMVGTGEDVFSPEGTLTNAECLTLALRLYDLQRGGDGTLETAPEDWGYAVFTFPDGQTRKGYIQDDTVWAWARFSRADDGHLCFHLETEEERAWGQAMDYQKATFSMNGADFSGELHLMREDLLYFEPDADSGADFRTFMKPSNYPLPQHWYRDAYYTAEAWGLRDWETHPGFAELRESVKNDNATRRVFATALADAAGELEKKYDVETIPDLERTGNEAIFSLYEAGILNGADEEGAFQPGKTLTRAEAAVMVARALDDTQRLNPADAARQTATSMTAIAGFYHRPYEELPQELRDNLEWDGQVRTEEGYNFRLRDYTGSGIVITTTEAKDEALKAWLDWQLSLPEDDEAREGTDEELRAEYEQEKGREWLSSVTITDDSYATVLGLKVGDTVEEAEALGYQLRQRLDYNGETTYGYTWEQLRIYVENDVVQKLRLSWGMGRYAGKYWDL